MYAVVTWEIDPTGDVSVIEADAKASLDPRKTCEIHGDVRVAELAGNIDYLLLVKSLEVVAARHDPLFTFAAFQLRRNSPLRSNGDFDEECVSDVQS